MNARSAPLGPPDVESWCENRPHSVADMFGDAPVETQAQLDDRLAAMQRTPDDDWWLNGWANPLEYGRDGRSWGD